MRGGLVGCTGVVEARRYLGPSHSSLLAVLPRGRASRAIQVVKSTLKFILVTFKDYLTKTMTQEGSRSISLDVPCTKPKTCVNCRRRKIKCDSERPKCGKCSRSIGFQDCEYVEDGPTRTEILEEEIAILEARIEELEKPKELRSTVGLHDPYVGAGSSPALSQRNSSVHLPIACAELSSSPWSMPTSSTEEIPLSSLEPLIHNFLHHSSQFGFFLNVHNFREATIGRSGQPPTAVLLDVVCLWAIHLSGSDEFTACEASYLARALRTAVDALSGPHHHHTIFHCIQAEVLLSHYFLRNTRFLEGKYHLSAAVSLVISSGLHRTRSADSYVGGCLGSGFSAMPLPMDATEEAERINAFWTVLTLNNCWTTADGSPSNIAYADPDVGIDTPWPSDINAPHLHNSCVGTVSTFLANLPDDGVSIAALHAKAAILFEKASRLASQCCPDMTNEQLTQFYLSFNTIDALIERFKISLPAVHLHPTRSMLVIHTLVHVATIQLHNPFISNIDASHLRALDAARAVVATLAQVPVHEFVFIDPIMGPLLMTICQVFLTELRRFKHHRPLHGPVRPEERVLMDAMDTVVAVMSVFAPNCRLMDSQLLAMQQLYHGL
ncbi:Zn(2)-Cys(6) binuclear cluster domain-containing protein [Mycena leptocephala]|nr:Zn(2)-Cys(6) binuclear cluster domain-containing protein [Mycena leptocephala]